MPRQYYYTPILIEQQNLGAMANGNYIETDIFSPGMEDPSNPGTILPATADKLICLRVDLVNSRCVVSIEQGMQVLDETASPVDIGAINWEPKTKSEVMQEYTDIDPNSDLYQIDFTVEEGL